MRECRCGQLFEALAEFDVICDDCWYEALQSSDEEEDDENRD